MADEFGADIRGFPELADGSEELFERIGKEAGERFQGVAERTADAVRGRVPRETGALAASVAAEFDPAAQTAIVGIGDDDTPYAGWIEFGGQREGRYGGIAERPYIPRGRYLYPAAFDSEPVLVATGAEAARDEIGRFRWEKPTP